MAEEDVIHEPIEAEPTAAEPEPTELTATEPAEPSAPEPKKFPAKLAVVLVVAAVFAGVLTAKSLTPAPETSVPVASTSGGGAVADYQEAVQSGKPIYLLFRSQS